MKDASPSSSDRCPLSRLLGLLALLAVLCLPAMHAMHLRVAEGEGHVSAAHVGHEHGHPTHGETPQPRHDASHCAFCLSAQSIHGNVALFDLTAIVAFDAPVTFPPALYLAPHADAFVPIVAIPRGPPACA